jgi:hypothetical protein
MYAHKGRTLVAVDTPPLGLYIGWRAQTAEQLWVVFAQCSWSQNSLQTREREGHKKATPLTRFVASLVAVHAGALRALDPCRNAATTKRKVLFQEREKTFHRFVKVREVVDSDIKALNTSRDSGEKIQTLRSLSAVLVVALCRHARVANTRIFVKKKCFAKKKHFIGL